MDFNTHGKKLAAYLEEDVNTKIIGFCETQENVQEQELTPYLIPLKKQLSYQGNTR